MKITEQAYRLLETRYKSRNENVEDIYPRVARAIAKHAPDVANGTESLEKEFLRMMLDSDFLPNSPCIRNAGYNNMNKACFVLPVEDSIHGIYKALLESAQIFKAGGGVGYNFSDLREEGAPLSAGGTSSGALSFMNMFNASTEAVKQGGFRRGACVSQDTRALTRTGWKSYNELKAGDEILTFCPETNTTKFQPILKMNVFDWDGEMISFKNKFMDFLFTPNHRVIYKSSSVSNAYSICRADSVPFVSIYVPLCSVMEDDRVDADISDELIQIAGWIITEGARKGNGNINGFTIYQSERANPDKCKEIDALFDKLGWKYSKNPDNKHYMENKERAWYVPAYETRNILRIEDNHKIIPMWMLEKLSLRQLQILFNTLMKGDGHTTSTWGKFTTADKEGAYRFLMLTTLLGYRASIKAERGGSIYSISINFNRKSSTVKQEDINKEMYTGKVWCPTVESGFWVAERNGYVCITGNSMGVLDYDHPEIINFIQEKGKYGRLNNFNVSVMLDDDFMKRVQTDDEIYLKSRLDRRRTVQTMKARDLFNLISIYAWENGDPGVLFYNRINQDNPFYPNQAIRATNPCGEVPLFPYESCCLGSINLSNCVTSDGDLDKDKLKDMVYFGTLFLIGMNKATQFSIKECYTAQERYFRLGLGVMGYADMLMKMHILYDSAEALSTIDKIGKIMKLSAKFSPISVATRSIAPTGSLSILANCSSGIEPIFSSNYERHTTSGVFEEKRDSEYLRTAHEIEPIWHLKTLARWQKWIDNGVSKTINMPYNCSQSDVSDIYIKAWEMGCKGVTIFRDNCRGGEQVYKTKAPKCDGESCTL